MASGPDRIPCLIIGCRRTARRDLYPPGTSIICQKCYALAPADLKRRQRRLKRLLRKAGVTGWTDTRPDSPGRWLLIVHDQVWKKIVAAVTEARVGIG